MWVVLATLAALAMGAGILALFLPRFVEEATVTRRVRRLVAHAPQAAALGRPDEMAVRVQAISGRSPSRHGLRLGPMLEQAGLTWTRRQVYAGACVTGAVVALLSLTLGTPLPWAAAAGLATGTLAPLNYIRYRRDKRFLRFAEELPNALDIIARGVRAGLPMNDCIRTVARETKDPVSREFCIIEDEQHLGATLSEAVQRMAKRIPIDETRFLSIAVAVQNAEGGAIAETLLNLSRTLRERRRLTNKILAMTAEQSGSAKILAALPFLMLGTGYLLQLEHVRVLFVTGTGQVTLAIASVWVLLGFLVMSRMTRIDI